MNTQHMIEESTAHNTPISGRTSDPGPPKPPDSSSSSLKMSSREWLAVFGGAMGAFMAILDIQITNASLREIQGSIGLDVSEVGWISTAYLMAEIAVIPLTGYLTKVFGIRKYLVTNCMLFIVSSMLCGLAWNLQSLVFFRIFQGMTGGVLIPMSFQIILLVIPPAQRSIGLAIFGMTATLAPTLGPSLGGFLTSEYGWRSTFFINIFPGLLTLWALSVGLPNAKTDLSKLKNMDLLGTFLLCTGLSSMTYILEEGAKKNWFDDVEIQICFLVMCATLPIFFVTQLQRKEPLLNLRLLSDRNFGFSAMITTIAAIATYGGIYALSIYLGQIQQYPALKIGQIMMWAGIPQLFVMPLLPWLMKKVDLRLLAVVGLGLFAFSNELNAYMSGDYGGDQFRIALIIRAIGQPLFTIPLSGMAMALIRPADIGNASAIFNVLRNIGGSIGIALTSTALVSRQDLHFSNSISHLSLYDPSTVELLTGMKNYFLLAGSDPLQVQDQALTTAFTLAHREALVMSFNDVYFIMSVGIILALLLVPLLSKAQITGDSGAIH